MENPSTKKSRFAAIQFGATSLGLENLPRAIELCDIVEIFDNTESFECIARY